MWKTGRFKQLFPTISNQQQPATIPNNTTGNTINLAAIMQLVQATQAKPATPVLTPADMDTDSKLGLSYTAFAKLLTMCGVPLSCTDKIPELWIKLAEKGTS
jgi:hypothetical protein